MFLPLGSIGMISFSPSALIASHPYVFYELAGHAVGHILHGFMKRGRKRRGLNRKQLRKLNNRRRRNFVDNIIMHHQRLANFNRQILISNARERAMIRVEKLKQQSLQKQKDLRKSKSDDKLIKRTMLNSNLRERGKKIRGMNEAKRIRARSRWLSIASKSN